MRIAECVFALAGFARNRYYWYSFTFLKAILVTIVTVQASTDIDVVVKYQIESQESYGRAKIVFCQFRRGIERF
ncbi:hypothetical protein M2G69_13465 [Vibrio vulnificus]|nr:hypothetical protein [Vibrio vulnificus]MCU8407225.1 hypothetical protein [Vibrio vulnificus]